MGLPQKTFKKNGQGKGYGERRTFGYNIREVYPNNQASIIAQSVDIDLNHT